MKKLADEIAVLRKQLQALELQLEGKVEKGLEVATEKLKAHIEQARREDKSALVPGTSAVESKERSRLIAEAAYLRAERRGFTEGDPQQDWLEAEAEVDQTLLHGWPEKGPHETVSRKSVRQGRASKRG
jgi:hypothetical protein